LKPRSIFRKGTALKIEKKIHPKDTMSSEERIQAAVNLQTPDRVPVAPLFYYFVANYNNMSFAELYDPVKYFNGLSCVFDELGPWDAHYFVNAYDKELIAFVIPMKLLEPGEELPENTMRQFLEAEIMTPDDYEWIIEEASKIRSLAYARLVIERLIPRIWPDAVPRGWKAYKAMIPLITRNTLLLKREIERWRKRGVTPLHQFAFEAAFDTFSLARGLIEFSKDLSRYPDKVIKASDALTESYAFLIKATCRILKVKRAEIFVHRSSNDFISPRQFMKFSLPSLKTLVEKLAQDGISSILHCDGNWDLNLELMREFPAGRVVMQCDGTSDIFKAKEIIGDRVCIYGDVPANLLALGSPAQVDEYCHRLIEQVGKGGGFILGSGCELAPNAKPENVKVMMQSVVKYGYYTQSKE